MEKRALHSFVDFWEEGWKNHLNVMPLSCKTMQGHSYYLLNHQHQCLPFSLGSFPSRYYHGHNQEVGSWANAWSRGIATLGG